MGSSRPNLRAAVRELLGFHPFSGNLCAYPHAASTRVLEELTPYWASLYSQQNETCIPVFRGMSPGFGRGTAHVTPVREFRPAAEGGAT